MMNTATSYLDKFLIFVTLVKFWTCFFSWSEVQALLKSFKGNVSNARRVEVLSKSFEEHESTIQMIPLTYMNLTEELGSYGLRISSILVDFGGTLP